MASFKAITAQGSAFIELLPVIQMNAYLATWLATGAILYQLFLGIVNATLPETLKYVAWLPVAYLVLHFLRGFFVKNYLPETINKSTTVVYDEDGTDPGKLAANGIVCFVVGSQQNHQMGIFAPGVRTIAKYFKNMWALAEADPDRYGFLGKTEVQVGQRAHHGNTLVHLSYWRSRSHLQAFALGETHKAGWNWWVRTKTQWPHLGIFHETYDVPPGQWETIYENFHPFGMGNTMQYVASKGEKVKSLVPTRGSKHSSMQARMGG